MKKSVAYNRNKRPSLSGARWYFSKVAPRIVLGMVVLLFAFAQAIAQPISGRVTDPKGEALPGVSVVIKGTSIGTLTDTDGTYRIDVETGNELLIFSFIGYKSQEILLANRTRLDLILQEDVASLDEVVVIGYGELKKTDLTGSVVRANIKSFKDQGNTNILQSLQGTVPGLNIGTTTTAGENPSFAIRGQTGLASANSAPLLVVDGIIYRGSLQDINSDDIMSVDVLKDASSTAIYGSQAANGVIIITTETGSRSSKPVIQFSSRYSLRADANPLEYYGGDGYLQVIRDHSWQQSGVGPTFTIPNPAFDPTDFLTPQEYAGFERGSNVQWRDLIMQQGFMQNQNLSISGRNEKIGYFISGSYLDQKEVFKGDTYRRYTGRINLDTEVSKWLSIGTNTFATFSDHAGIEFSTVGGSTFSPFSAPFDEQGNLVRNPNGQISTNPLLLENDIDVDQRLHINSLIYARLQIPGVEGLSYRLNYGNSYRTLRQNRFSFTANNNNGQAYKDFTLFHDWTLDHILSYERTFQQKHRLNLTLLYGHEQRYGEGTRALGNNYAIQTLGIHSLQNAAQEFISSSAFDENSLYSMGRINYALHNRYILTATIRRDGFSGFGKNNKTAIFPSMAFGWTISEEPFMREIASTLSYLKVRGSYGVSGNRGLERYGTLARVAVRDGYVFGDGGTTRLGQNLTSFAAADLKWETTTGLNLGVDYELFNRIISGTIDYYNSNTRDILFLKPLPAITGLTGVSANIGQVHNHGFETIIRSNNLPNSKLQWTTQFNLARNVNRIVSVLGTDSDGDGREDDLRDAGLFIGQSTGAIYNYEIDGLYQIGDEIPPGFEPGFLRIRDLDGNGEINSLDRTIIGRAEPAYQFGILNELKLRSFKFSFFINSIQGGKNGYLGNNSPWQFDGWNDARLGKIESNRPVIWDYWTPSNPDAEYPSLRYNSSANPSIFKSRSFVRLQDVNLTYTIPEKLLAKAGLKQASVFASGRNLATWTRWKGLDPESGLGISYGRPVIRSINFGLNLSF
ncbi:SusC/RagA family TonB-linked outer membrane protein [Arundinibacter roseus]|uniref:SusC/RagA family TonB-linked outer membrane protein n=1 Tax=Arundinibacter roseus TaxID=2070510 RepID=A0A4R4K5H8_9BACT|nr:SusC/RagA family TonB-linked outer membrane protein [Arundinibacter roseus]TDB62727.1 SusC/RagA family TonB-linked outer membrane protein [Arundinibacter roseus]